MQYNKKIFNVVFPTTVLIAILSMLFYFFNNLEEKFLSSYESNVMFIESKVSKINDILELEGAIANELINKDNIADDFNQHKYAEIIEYFEYDKENNIFHSDKVLNSKLNTEILNSVTGSGGLDFLNDDTNIKTKEVYLSILMSDGFSRMNEKILSSYWVYYTSYNGILSIRNSSNEYITSDIFYFVDELRKKPFLTQGKKEIHKERDSVFWSYPYIDLGNGGVMITASYPVDYKDEYIGSISVDIKSTDLNELLNERYKTFIMHENGNIISANMYDFEKEEMITVENLPVNLKYEEISNLKDDFMIEINGTKVISKKLAGSPYILYEVYLAKDYWRDMFFDVLPLIVFIILFIIINLIYFRVLESEGKLKLALKNLQIKKDELDYLSKYDQLTKVYNRRGLYSELKKIFFDENIKELSLMILDIDHFKKVNDTYGHNIGDEILVQLCEVINNTVDNNCIVARYGGEEFVVVAKDRSFEVAVKLAEEIRQAVEKNKFSSVENLTISIGVAEYSNQESKEIWFKNADDALYRSKGVGRNIVSYYKDYKIKSYPEEKEQIIKLKLCDNLINVISLLTIPISLFNLNGEFLYGTKEFFALIEEDKKIKNFDINKFLPEYQSNGEISSILKNKLYQKALSSSGEEIKVKLEICSNSGKVIETAVKYKKVNHENKAYIMCIFERV